MSIKIIDGNLFDSKAKIIAHQVNCQGKMNSGVAKEVRQRYPHVACDLNCSVAMPYKIGCVRGGANWDEVYSMIEKAFKNIDVELWRLDKG